MLLTLMTVRLSIQIAGLNDIFASMKNEELLKTRKGFEDRAMLYYNILMDIQDLLTYKADFVSRLDPKQIE